MQVLRAAALSSTGKSDGMNWDLTDITWFTVRSEF